MRLGKPRNPEVYERLDSDGLTVFWKPGLAELFGDLTVKVESLLFVKFLVVATDKR